MKTRLAKAALVSTGIVVALIVGWLAVGFFQPREPVYGGKRLSYWVAQLGGMNQELQDQAIIAIRKIGPPGIPFLATELRRKEALWSRLYRTAWPRIPTWMQDRLPGPKIQNGDREWPYAYALGLTGPSSIPYLVAALSDRNEQVRRAVVRAIQDLGINVDDVVPGLVRLLNDPDVWGVRNAAISALGQRPDRRQFVPVLTRALKDKATVRTAARVLGRIGSDAAGAVPELHRLLPSARRPFRQDIALALCQICQDTNAMQILISEISKPTGSGEYQEMIDVLGEMGAKAKPAVPAILQSLKTRSWRSDQEWWKSLYIQAVRRAVTRVDPSAVAQLPAEAK